jgi:hypothetical protein
MPAIINILVLGTPDVFFSCETLHQISEEKGKKKCTGYCMRQGPRGRALPKLG